MKALRSFRHGSWMLYIVSYMWLKGTTNGWGGRELGRRREQWRGVLEGDYQA